MPFLIVPPVEFVTENPELKARLAKSAEAYVTAQLSALNVSTQPRRIASGAFQGTAIFPWTGKTDLVLHTQFLFPRQLIRPFNKNSALKNFEKKPLQTESVLEPFAKISTLVRVEGCLHLGSTWTVTAGNDLQPPNEFLATPPALSEALSRSPDFFSTFRLDTHFVGNFSNRTVALHDAFIGNTLAKLGWPVNTSLSRLGCEWAQIEPGLIKERAAPLKSGQYPDKGHRLLVTRLFQKYKPAFLESTPKAQVNSMQNTPPGNALFETSQNTFWPEVEGTVALHSGVFGEKNREILKIPLQTFSPAAFYTQYEKELRPVVHNLREENFTIQKRQGRWVTLNRGRAYGLTIGLHLVGPGESKLHIIQFTPAQNSPDPDLAIAFVRSESQTSPLKPGDVLQYDPMQFPVQK